MTPATAMIARRMSMTIAVAGRTPGSYAPHPSFPHSVRILHQALVENLHSTVGERPQLKMPRPPNGGGGPGYMKDGSPPWGGLGGYPITPRVL